MHSSSSADWRYSSSTAQRGSVITDKHESKVSRVQCNAHLVEAQSVSMCNFAANITGSVGEIIVNKTELLGTYNFALQWAPAGTNPSDPQPSIFTAFEEQLGLKPICAKDPVDVFGLTSWKDRRRISHPALHVGLCDRCEWCCALLILLRVPMRSGRWTSKDPVGPHCRLSSKRLLPVCRCQHSPGASPRSSKCLANVPFDTKTITFIGSTTLFVRGTIGCSQNPF